MYRRAMHDSFISTFYMVQFSVLHVVPSEQKRMEQNLIIFVKSELVFQLKNVPLLRHECVTACLQYLLLFGL